MCKFLTNNIDQSEVVDSKNLFLHCFHKIAILSANQNGEFFLCTLLSKVHWDQSLTDRHILYFRLSYHGEEKQQN